MGGKTSQTDRIARRSYLKALGLSIPVAGMAGEAQGYPSSSNRNELVIGTVESPRPRTLNFANPARAANVVFDTIYDRGIRFHPDDGEIVPWMFSDWTLYPDNAGTPEPTVVAELRDDLEWSDGVDVTASDVVFSWETVGERASGANLVDVAHAEATGRYEVSYTFDERAGEWPSVLSFSVVPKHIWEDVDDLRSYDPRKDGAVSSGPFEVTDLSVVEADGEQVFEEVQLEARRQYPIARDKPFLRNGGPFVSSVRVRYYESEADLRSAYKNGDADLAFGLSIDSGKQLQNSGTTIRNAPKTGWSHCSFNLRRVPFDDKSFRQFLNRAWDEQLHTQESGEGFLTDGDLPTPPHGSVIRPHPPGAQEVERFKMFRTPDGELDVAEAREFLETADGIHDFTFASVENEEYVTGDKEIRVNGELLTEAHTNNDGEPGQGPLVLVRDPGEAQPVVTPSLERWVDNLRNIGVPVEVDVVPFRQQLGPIYRKQDFDMFEMGWTRTDPTGGSLDPLFGERGINDVGFSNNPMGYTGAQEFIDRAASAVDQTERRKHVGDALMQIYEDNPTMIFDYDRSLQVLDDGWSGWMPGIGMREPVYPLLNIRRGNGRGR